MNEITLDSSAWNKLIAEAEKKLVGSSSVKISIDLAIIGNQAKSIPDEVPKESGIYAIWVNDVAKYVGEAKNLRARLRAHLIYRSEKTGSKLENVKQENAKGSSISVSFMHVEPESIRLAVEDKLISRLRETDTGNYDLEWNTQSTSDAEITKWVEEKLSALKNGMTAFEYLYYAYMEEMGVVNDDESMNALNAVLQRLADDNRIDYTVNQNDELVAVKLK